MGRPATHWGADGNQHTGVSDPEHCPFCQVPEDS